MNILHLILIALAIVQSDASPSGRGSTRQRVSSTDQSNPKAAKIPRVGQAGCVVSIKTVKSQTGHQPLLLIEESLGLDYLRRVDNDGKLRFEPNEKFRLACTGENNYLRGVGNSPIQITTAFCEGGKKFTIDSQSYEFGNLRCVESLETVARKMVPPCFGDKAKIEIGFDLSECGFLRTMEVCFDGSKNRTLYVHSNLTKNIAGYDSGVTRNGLWSTAFIRFEDIERQYVILNERETVKNILQEDIIGENSQKTQRYFAKGHLTPKTDFIYAAFQLSTFYHLDAAPQWQKFNAGNWFKLEKFVRNYATQKQLDLEIYTGTHGILKLPDIKRVRQPMYLYAVGQERALEIPLYFWKIMYHPSSKKGTAFVGVNNLDLDGTTKTNYQICPDMSKSVAGFRNKVPEDNYQYGYTYACTIDGLRRTVQTLPALEVHGLLT